MRRGHDAGRVPQGRGERCRPGTPLPVRAKDILRRCAKAEPKIEFFLNHVSDEILGQDKVGAGRLRHVLMGAERILRVDGVFVCIGLAPRAKPVHDQLALDERGQIVVDAAVHTSLPGMYAIGDVRSGAADHHRYGRWGQRCDTRPMDAAAHNVS